MRKQKPEIPQHNTLLKHIFSTTTPAPLLKSLAFSTTTATTLNSLKSGTSVVTERVTLNFPNVLLLTMTVLGVISLLGMLVYGVLSAIKREKAKKEQVTRATSWHSQFVNDHIKVIIFKL